MNKMCNIYKKRVGFSSLVQEKTRKGSRVPIACKGSTLVLGTPLLQRVKCLTHSLEVSKKGTLCKASYKEGEFYKM
jgi:hypothetical protein